MLFVFYHITFQADKFNVYKKQNYNIYLYYNEYILSACFLDEY